MRAPDQAGIARAWRVKHPDPPVEPAHQAGVATWLVNGPYHPLWSWWMLSIVSLRDIPGVPPATKHYPEAQYEFLIISIDPNVGVPDLEAIESGDDWAVEKDGQRKFLSPVDVVVQFDGVDDAGALRVGETAIRAIVAGHSTDSAFRSWWERAIRATVDHERTGGSHLDPPGGGRPA